MTAGDSFYDCRTSALRAARDLYGPTSFEYLSVGIAFGLCGVGTVPVPTPTEILTNNGLESTAVPFTFVGTGAVYVRSGTTPHGGRGYATLGITNSGFGYFYSNPGSFDSNTANATLSFWVWITTADSSTSPTDRMYVEFKDSSTGVLLGQVAVLSNRDATSGYVKKSYNVMAYKGYPLQLQFRVLNDGNGPTTFKVDDISIALTVY